MLRGTYDEVFAADSHLQHLAYEQRPAKRSKAESIDTGNRVQQGELKADSAAYTDVDYHTISLWYHDKNKHTIYDLAHEFSNVLKQMMSFIKNKKKDRRQGPVRPSCKGLRD